MKTTLNLPDALMESVKQRAKSESRTQTRVIEDAIRRYLSEARPVSHRTMPTFGASGTNALLVDIEDKDALYEVLDGTSGDRGAL